MLTKLKLTAVKNGLVRSFDLRRYQMFFAHVIQDFTVDAYLTYKHPENGVGGYSNYNAGSRIKALGWEGDRVVCEDGIGTFLAPVGTIIVGYDEAEYLLSTGEYVKFTAPGCCLLVDEEGTRQVQVL